MWCLLSAQQWIWKLVFSSIAELPCIMLSSQEKFKASQFKKIPPLIYTTHFQLA
jgi:hypothetical protein